MRKWRGQGREGRGGEGEIEGKGREGEEGEWKERLRGEEGEVEVKGRV